MTTTAVDEFEPAHAGSWTRADRREANHEAAHAVVAVLCGLTVCECRIDRPDSPWCCGFTRVEPDVDNLRGHLLSTIAGNILYGGPIGWPPRLGVGGDEGVAAIIVERVAMDGAAWQQAHDEVINLLKANKAAMRAVSAALLERGALRGAEVHRLVAEAATSP